MYPLATAFDMCSNHKTSGVMTFLFQSCQHGYIWLLVIHHVMTYSYNSYLSISSHYAMMTSSYGNIFRVTGPLRRESNGDRWIPPTKASDVEFDVFFDRSEQTVGHNNRDAGDLRRHHAHYDVTWRHCNVETDPVISSNTQPPFDQIGMGDEAHLSMSRSYFFTDTSKNSPVRAS